MKVQHAFNLSYYRISILLFDKMKIPANFWIDKGHPISPRALRGQTLILKNLASKITKFVSICVLKLEIRICEKK